MVIGCCLVSIFLYIMYELYLRVHQEVRDGPGLPPDGKKRTTMRQDLRHPKMIQRAYTIRDVDEKEVLEMEEGQRKTRASSRATGMLMDMVLGAPIQQPMRLSMS